MITIKPGTAICSTTLTRNDTAALVDPVTSYTVSIYYQDGTEVVTDHVMSKTSTGLYYYAFDTSAASLGTYRVKYKAINGSNTSVQIDTFTLEN